MPAVTAVKVEPPTPRDVTGWVMRPAAELANDETARLQEILGR
ncbi:MULTISPECIES: hypothetical protein [unclassified Nocardia]|nr:MULTISPECIES: hypothetical protein [unclassified Nocardia]